MKSFRPILVLALSTATILILAIACDKLITETTEVTLTGYPRADFEVSADSCCRPCSLQFFDNSDGPRDVFIWAFGDGDSAFTVNPFHYYTDTGDFDVTLVIRENTSGNEDNEIKVNYIRILDTIPKIPAQSFFTIVEDLNDSLKFTFTDSTRGTIKTWRWDFGDTSAFGSTKIAVHTYADTGTYPIRLTIKNFCDSTDLFDTLVVD